MNDAEKELLQLLKCALHGQVDTAAADTDWASVLNEANIQTVTALAASALPATLTDEERKPWKNVQYGALSFYMRYMLAQDELCRLFSENEIPMVILKGAAAAVYYPQPAMRMMGDIDFIVPKECFQRAHSLMRENGFALTGEYDGRHEEWKKNGIEYELHSRFSHTVDVEEYITQGFDSLERGNLDGHAFPMLPKLSNGMVLLDHMRGHLSNGLGLRQVIDWMLYVERELDDAFWESTFQKAAGEKKLDTLAITATRVCQQYLGLSERIHWCAGADEELCGLLMENLLRTGNFGRKNGRGNNVEKVSAAIRRKGFFRNLQDAGEHNWKLLRRHAWLQPAAWLYQICRYTRQILKAKRGRELTGDFERGEERYELLKKLNLY